MYTMELGGVLCYAPFAQDESYAVQDLQLTEEINKASSLTFTLPVCNRAYNMGDIHPLKTNVVLRRDDEIVFSGRVLSWNRSFYNSIDFTCEGMLAWLNDSIIPPHTKNCTVQEYVDYVLGLHNAQVNADRQITGVDISDVDTSDLEAEEEITGYTLTYRGVTRFYTITEIAQQVIRGGFWGSGAVRRKRLEAAGCCYELIQNEVNRIFGKPATYTVNNTTSTSSGTTISVENAEYVTSLDCLTGDWLSQAGYCIRAGMERVDGVDVPTLYLMTKNGSVGDQEVRFGNNLMDFEEAIDATGIYTRVIPLGKENARTGLPLTIETTAHPNNYIENENLASLYGKITRTIYHNDITTAAALLAAGEEDIKAGISTAITLTVKAIDMGLLDPSEEYFFIGGWNLVSSPPHNYNEYLQCTRIVRNLQNPGQDEFTFGSAQDGITSTISYTGGTGSSSATPSSSGSGNYSSEIVALTTRVSSLEDSVRNFVDTDTNTTYTLGRSGYTISLTDNSGNVQSTTLPSDTNTTYTLGRSGYTISLTDSSGNVQSTTLPSDTNTTYSLGGSSDQNGYTITLTDSGGNTQSTTVPTSSGGSSVTINTWTL